jgi:hypothetical protein
MLVIHWTKHNKTKDIISNGLRQSTRTRTSIWVDQSGELKQDKKKIKGLWCYPYTLNRTLNNQWKKNLKTWERKHTNFNGIVFRLTKEDFSLYAGHFIATGEGDQALMKNLDELKQLMTGFPSKSTIDINENSIDTDEFEIVLLNKVRPERIIKIIKDRDVKKNYR